MDRQEASIPFGYMMRRASQPDAAAAQRLFEAATTGIALTSLEGRFLEVNPAFCELTQRAAAEFLESDVFSVIHPDELDEVRDHRRKLKAGEVEDLTTERRIVASDGNIVWLFIKVALVRDSDGQPSEVILMSDDITARKTAEARLRESEALRQIAGQTARLGGWSVDLVNRTVSWSDEVMAIVRSIITSMDGSVAVENIDDGCCMTLRLATTRGD